MTAALAVRHREQRRVPVDDNHGNHLSRWHAGRRLFLVEQSATGDIDGDISDGNNGGRSLADIAT